MLDNNKIQYIGKIENSNNVVIINGNLTIDGQISKGGFYQFHFLFLA